MQLLNWVPQNGLRLLEWLDGQAWIIGWSAINNYAAGDHDQSERIRRVVKKLKEASIEVVARRPVAPPLTEEESLPDLRLHPGGATTYLRDDEYRVLKEAVNWWRTRVDREGWPVVRGAQTEALLRLDEILEKAETISDEELAKRHQADQKDDTEQAAQSRR